jgi:signal transduction histidine kinase
MAATKKKTDRPERTDTDESLGRERDKTDREMSRVVPQIEADADEVLEIARKRAAATLDVARDRADATLEESDARPSTIAAVATERAVEDRALENQRREAAKVLDTERSDRARALTELLAIERDETDDRLELERIRADDVVASRDDFLGMVSHDLRNLLGGIALSASLVMRRTTDERTKDEAARIQRCTARMTRLVGDLIDVVSMEAGRLSVLPEQHEPSAVLRDVAETFRVPATQKDISLTVQAPGADGPVPMDVERVQQVLSNLVGNAIKFTRPGGEVEMHLTREAKTIKFTVLDNGPGIDAESATKIFDRFWQSAPEDRRGLGLGLYISRNIVEAHGGKIWFEARTPRGSAFHFTLPVR